MKNNLGILVLILTVLGFHFLKKERKIENVPRDNRERSSLKYTAYKNLRFEHQYEEKYPLPVIENLVLPGKIRSFGIEGHMAQMMMSLCWKPITDAVEDRYNLPQGFIFAMTKQESTGVEFLLNGVDDGGAGLCHMQGEAATEFGLKTFNGCTERICPNHGISLERFIEANRNNRALLAKTDERLHHIKNLDAVGRMLACHMDGPAWRNLGPLRTALHRYTGKNNYDDYRISVKQAMNWFEDKAFLKKVEKEFNKLNRNLLIDGKPGNWKMYLEAYRKICENYGLSKYKALRKYLPKNSEIVLATYRRLL